MPSGGREVPDSPILAEGDGFEIFAMSGEDPVLAALSVNVSDDEAIREMVDLHTRCGLVGLHQNGGVAALNGKATPRRLRRLGETLNRLEGQCVLFPGKGAAHTLLREIREVTPHVIGLDSGDPSRWTALGILAAIRGCLGDLKGKRVAVQGVGRVGAPLIEKLLSAGATVLAADLDAARAEASGAEVMDPEEILFTECDILSPNARGVRLTEEEISRLRCRILVGTDDVLRLEGSVEALVDRDILFLPERMVSTGWLLSMALELSPEGWSEERAAARVDSIEDVARGLLPPSRER